MNDMSHVMTGKQGVRRHVESVHKGLKCELKLSLSYELSRHKKNIHFKATVYWAETTFLMISELNSGWRWMQCGKESKSKALLKMHIEFEYMGITHTCEMCDHKQTKYTIQNHCLCL